MVLKITHWQIITETWWVMDARMHINCITKHTGTLYSLSFFSKTFSVNEDLYWFTLLYKLPRSLQTINKECEDDHSSMDHMLKSNAYSFLAFCQSLNNTSLRTWEPLYGLIFGDPLSGLYYLLNKSFPDCPKVAPSSSNPIASLFLS